MSHMSEKAIDEMNNIETIRRLTDQIQRLEHYRELDNVWMERAVSLNNIVQEENAELKREIKYISEVKTLPICTD